MTFETENIEFKAQFTEELYKEVIAFANTDGGTVYVGIDNEGNAVGLQNVDEEYTRITNGIRDAIAPDITLFIRYTIQDNRVVRIAVSEGTNKPYYLKSKGLKPSGVFVRQGTSSVPASPDKIRRMIKESDGDIFEEMRAPEQELTFTAAEKAFTAYGVEFSGEKFRSLGLTQSNSSVFTNAALLVSDQCRHTIKVAVFGDEANTVFVDRKEFGGSVFAQLEEVYRYLSLCNKTASAFSGLTRIDKKDYPDAALREALLNAIVHRDYSFSGSIIINVNSSSIEFISIGGLMPGLTRDDILNGISQPRNRNIAEIFHRLRLIESYGTGLRRIFKLYEQCELQPQIDVTANSFRLTLPNMNAAQSVSAKEDKLNEHMQAIMKLISDNGYATDASIEETLHLKKTRIYTITKHMTELGMIRRTGRGDTKQYIKG